mgnify:CR=1 FL=1
MKATARDLRTQAKRILDAVAHGQAVTITHRGRPRARLVPIRAGVRGARRV